ncbi:uncharacterized protein V1516DRAFT_670734 [Lipomyces oligophaga]|uniref:uncharacterized protein n=1 Tax=Lipomyces oligophaga TaxID=45792 RepID=UPI0034CED2E7
MAPKRAEKIISRMRGAGAREVAVSSFEIQYSRTPGSKRKLQESPPLRRKRKSVGTESQSVRKRKKSGSLRTIERVPLYAKQENAPIDRQIRELSPNRTDDYPRESVIIDPELESTHERSAGEIAHSDTNGSALLVQSEPATQILTADATTQSTHSSRQLKRQPKRKYKSQSKSQDNLVHLTAYRLQGIPSRGAPSLSAVDVVSEFLTEQLTKVSSACKSRLEQTTLSIYTEGVQARFAELCDVVNSAGVARHSVRKAQARMKILREDLLKIRQERVSLADEIHQIRTNYILAQKASAEETLTKDMLSALPDIRIRAKQYEADALSMETVDNRRYGVTAELCRLGPLVSGDAGILRQLQTFNHLLKHCLTTG